MAALDGAIYIRKVFSNTLIQQRDAEQTTSEERQADETHDHFTKVLENVRRILTPITERRAPASTGSSRQHNDGLANAFAKLRVDGLTTAHAAATVNFEEYMDNEPDYSNITNRLSDKVLPECQDTPEEYSLLFKVLLQDYSKLRAIVQETWQRYHEGLLDLASAAVAVDMAIRFARQLEDQHRDTFRSHASNMANTSVEIWKKIAQQLGTSNKSIKKIPNNNIYFHLFYNSRQGLKPEHGEKVARILTRGHTLGYDESKSPFTGIFATLSMFHFQVVTKKLAAASPDKIPRARKGHFGDCDINKDTQNLSDAERSNHYNALLLEALVESTLLEGSELPIDEFSRCAMQLVKEERLDLWMVFAAQAYVDGCSVLGRNIGRPLDQLKGFTGTSLCDGAGIKEMRTMTTIANLDRARWDHKLVSYHIRVSRNVQPDQSELTDRIGTA